MTPPDWSKVTISEDKTHHLRDGRPVYSVRFDEVLKFHAPGLAPVRRGGLAWHININGTEAYPVRFLRTFGFYEGTAAVAGEDGWVHIYPDGGELYRERYAWCGNFQGGRCAVRNKNGEYLHLDQVGGPAYSARYAYAGDFRDGFAVVQERNGRSTHIDSRGQLVHGQWYWDLDVFHKGAARARDDGGWMHITEDGMPRYARRFAAVEPFYNGQARVERSDGGLEVIDENGEPLVELRAALHDDFSMLSADMVGFWKTYALRAAAELRVLDVLPGSLDEVSQRCGVNCAWMLRLLRALSELHLVEETTQATDPHRKAIFQATGRGQCLRTEHPFSLREAALHWADSYGADWAALSSVLSRGTTDIGRSWFAQLQDSPEALAAYHRILTSYARHDYASIATLPFWQSHEHVLDAGGGTGALLEMLLSCHPHLRGTLLERPEVAALATWPSPIAQRIQVWPGDFLSPWGRTADAVCLAKVLHDWPDNEAANILQHARTSLTPSGDKGRLYIIEGLLSQSQGHGGLLDLHMMVSTSGRERTQRDFDGLLAAAGLVLLCPQPLNRWLNVLVCGVRSTV